MTINSETISLIIGVSSFVAAIIFFFAARESENSAIRLLAKIDERVESLRVINNSMLERAIGHIATSNEQLINMMSTNKLRETIGEITDSDSYLLLAYSYNVRTNFLAKAYYTIGIASDQSKSSLKKIIDLSCSDNEIISNAISKIDQLNIKK